MERHGWIFTDLVSQTHQGRSVVVEIDDNNCYNVISHRLNDDGYFRKAFLINGKKVLKMYHRYVWERDRGAIPDGFEVDHICRNRKCCNVNHLQLLSITDHKVKTNKERYKQRIEGVVFLIEEGYPNSKISEAFGVSDFYVNHYRRKLKNGT